MVGTAKSGCATLRGHVNSATEKSPAENSTTEQPAGLLPLLRQGWLRITVISVVLLVPCFWHRRIEAGDLASHVYNAWLAELIQKGQAPGLYIARQWNNVLFDLMLLKLGNIFGLPAAEKIAVPVCVLIFFWGVFTLIVAMTKRSPWFLLPCVAMLAYGWTFSVGFLNYYLSLGLGFFVIAAAWRGQRMQWIWASGLAALVFVAHPQGFAWLVGCVGYVILWRALPRWWKLALPAAAAVMIVAVRVYCAKHYEMWTVWDSFGPWIYNGSDQLALYGKRYLVLAEVAMLFGIACFVGEAARRIHARESWEPLRLPLELYGIVVFGTYVLPDVLRIPLYSGWIGAMALRLTTISAALGLCVLGVFQPRKWHAAGFAAIAVVFFVFLYQDTGVLNRIEQHAEKLISTLPPGQRVLATIWAPPDSRVPYVVHIVDRACIGKCFSYENYEPSSSEFRVRARQGSPVAAADADDRQDMELGDYVVQEEDLPMWQIYQCDEKDLTKLCLRELAAGEANGRLGYHPPKD